MKKLIPGLKNLNLAMSLFLKTYGGMILTPAKRSKKTASL
jgi:hypothetical protein